jgi:glycerol uptake facilitator protein
MASLSTRCIAEGVGTGLLVYFGAGAVPMALMLAAGTTPATPFNIGIGQLGGLADWFAIGMSFAIILTVVIYTLGRVSGAHLNPAVTLALLVTKRFPAGDTVGYIIAQVIGASIGSLLFFLTVGMDAVTIGGWEPRRRFPGSGTARQSLPRR